MRLGGYRVPGARLVRMAAACLAVLTLTTGGAGATPVDPADLSRANALLAAGQPAEAKAIFQQLLEADPSSVPAHLGLARSYYALGQYSRALIEFESVLGYDPAIVGTGFLQSVGADLQSVIRILDGVAEDYAAGRTWAPFYYGETGIGVYRQNSSSSTDIFGGAGNYDTFLPVRVGGGWSARVAERHTFNGMVDYRFRGYDDSDRRNDSDLRWNFNLARPVDDDNLRFGMRGRVSFRGDGRYRNDWGAFATYSLGFGENDRLALTGELRERRYPTGPLRSRTRDIAEVVANWTHSLANGRTALSLGGSIAQEWSTQERVDGDASIWSIRSSVNHSFSDRLSGFFFLEYWDEAYDDERPDFTTDEDLLAQRTDELVYAGAGLVWNFAPGWDLRPTIEYDWEDSNIPALAYSKTEVWVTVRRSF